MRMKNNIYLHLLEHIYEAALNDSGWQHVVKQINVAFKSNAGGFFIQDDVNNESDVLLYTGVPQTHVDSYLQHYSLVNPWFAIPGMMDPNLIRTEVDIDVYYQQPGHFYTIEYYNDWMKDLDARHTMGGSLTTRGSLHLNFSMLRPQSAGVYSENDIHALKKLMPHLRRALEVSSLMRKSHSQHQLILQGLDHMGIGLMLLSEHHLILELNETAENIVRQDDGLMMVKRHLRARYQSAQAKLQALFERQTYVSGSTRYNMSDWLFIPRTHQRAAYQLMLIACESQTIIFDENRAKAMLIIIDPAQQTQLPRNKIQNCYQFTDRETDIAQKLTQGLSAREISADLDLTYESTRWYIKQICQKSGTRTQTEFVAKVLSHLSLLI